MLGNYYRFRAHNSQNQAITVALTGRLWKFASDGSITWSSEVTLIASGSVSATTGTAAGSDQDNSTDKWLGAELTLSCTAAAATNSTGSITITLERSTDAGTTWPTSGQGEVVGGYAVSSSDSTNARYRNLTVD